MAEKQEIEIMNPTPVPMYQDGKPAAQAHDRNGNHLMLTPGIRAWYWKPETLKQVELKHYLSFDSNGKIAYVQIFDLRGDPLLHPELVGLPGQQYWLKYKYCSRIDPVPPADKVIVPTKVRVDKIAWEGGLVLYLETLEVTEL